MSIGIILSAGETPSKNSRTLNFSPQYGCFYFAAKPSATHPTAFADVVVVVFLAVVVVFLAVVDLVVLPFAAVVEVPSSAAVVVVFLVVTLELAMPLRSGRKMLRISFWLPS